MALPQELAAVDLTAALERVGGDQELLEEIARIFLEQHPAALEQIRQAIAAVDGAVLEKKAHLLKGAVANFEAPRAADAAFRLEKAARVGDWQAAQAAFGELAAALEKVVGELTAFLESRRVTAPAKGS